MKISNLHNRSLIRWIVGVLLFVVVVDLVMVVFFNEFLDRFFTGYTAVAVPLLLVVAYSYVGYPLFTFDDTTNVLRVKSHLAMTRFFGKRLVVDKKNLLKLSIVRNRLSKKLKIHYLQGGKECVESFSIILLGNERIRNLAREVELIETEVNGEDSRFHFI